jgi:hypothetical protein
VYTYARLVLVSTLTTFMVNNGIGEIAVEDVLAAMMLVTLPYLYVPYMGDAGPVTTHAPPCLQSL